MRCILLRIYYESISRHKMCSIENDNVSSEFLSPLLSFLRVLTPVSTLLETDSRFPMSIASTFSPL